MAVPYMRRRTIIFVFGNLHKPDVISSNPIAAACRILSDWQLYFGDGHRERNLRRLDQAELLHPATLRLGGCLNCTFNILLTCRGLENNPIGFGVDSLRSERRYQPLVYKRDAPIRVLQKDQQRGISSLTGKLLELLNIIARINDKQVLPEST